MRAQGYKILQEARLLSGFIALLMVFGWISVGQTRELPVQTLRPVVLSDMRSRVARFDQVEPDCSAVAPLVVVKKPPTKGRIEIEEDMGFTNYAKETRQYKCNDQRTLGVAIFYTSDPGFKGTDRFEVEVFYATYAVSQIVRFTATIK
jgi:hypothetical protein